VARAPRRFTPPWSVEEQGGAAGGEAGRSPPGPGPTQAKNSIPDALALADTDADGPSYDGAYTGADRAAYAPPDAGSDNRSEPSEDGVPRAARCRRVLWLGWPELSMPWWPQRPGRAAVTISWYVIAGWLGVFNGVIALGWYYARR
jgi:hypothetical protein